MWIILMTAARRQQTSELFTVLQPLWVSLWHVEDGQFTDVVYLYHFLFPGRSLQSLYSVIFQPSPDLLHVFCVLYPFWNKANQDRSGPVQPATLLRTGLFFHVRISAGSHDSLPVYISDFLKTAMMDYIDSLRVACWHRRSNRTLGSFTPLMYVQNTVFTLTSSDFYSTCVMFCHQTLSADASFKRDKTKTIFMSMKVLSHPGQGDKVLCRRQLDLFHFHFHLCSSFHWSNNQRVWVVEINPWCITLCETFVSTRRFSPRCVWCPLLISHGGLRIYLQPNQRVW